MADSKPQELPNLLNYSIHVMTTATALEKQRTGITLAITAGVMFGTSGIFTKSITGISPVGIAASRLCLGFLFMGGLILLQGYGHELKRSRKHLRTFFILGILSSLHFLFYVLAVQKTYIANALILVNTAPILVLLFAPFFLKEPRTTLDIISVIITFLGAGLIAGFDHLRLSEMQVLGDLCAFGSAICYALYVMLARNLRQIYSSQVIMFWFFGLGALFLFLGGALFRDQFFASPPILSWIWILLLGLLPTGIGHFSYNLSLKYLPAARASTIILLEPVTGTLFALVFLAEIPPITTWIGMGVALIGIATASVAHIRKTPPIP